MNNYIVLLKQVPDIKEFDDNAFNKETGTLIRARLKNVLNELDREALSFAYRLKELEKSDGKIVCLTMGPLMAQEVLKYALARCADEVILLTDRVLGGADTVATASPLAEAIRKIKIDYFNGSDNFYVIAGMQSVDGDTAQVPSQIASELNIPCIPFITDVKSVQLGNENNKIVLTFNTLNGKMDVSPCKFPLVLTIAKYNFELYPSFERTRYAAKTNVTSWSFNDIANAKFIGMNGSKTQVVKVFAPPKINRKCIRLNNKEELLNAIKEALENKEVGDETKTHNTLSYENQETTYKGDAFVICEVKNNKISKGTFEALGKVVELSKSLGVNACALLVGANVLDLSKDLISYGAKKVYVVQDEKLNDFDPFVYKEVISQVLLKYKPQIVLSLATYFGRVVAPMVSYKLSSGLTADCTSLEIGDDEKKGLKGILLQTRPALGGNIMATIVTKNSLTQMATVREGVMKACECNLNLQGEVIKEDVIIDESNKSYEIINNSFQDKNNVEFSKDVILVGGRGLQNKENFNKYIVNVSKKLQEELNINVSYGASRAAVEQGFASREYQIGQTGTTVSPKVYIACGVSGAIQHTIGIQNSKTIISINTDKDAPIFQISDYYIVGDVKDIL